MTDIYIDNRYTRIYYIIVERARLRALRPINAEEHHIIPESFFKQRSRKGPPGWLDGDPDEPSNLVMLSLREHIVCHRLLTRMTTGIAKDKMDDAWWFMVHAKDENGQRYRISSRMYEILRAQFAARVSERTVSLWQDPDYASSCRAAMRESQNRPEVQARRSELSRERWQNVEHAEKMGAMSAAMWQDSEYRAAMSDCNVYTFQHKSGKIEKCTRHELLTKYDLNVRTLRNLFATSGRVKTACGWRLIRSESDLSAAWDYGKGLKHHRADHTIYEFIHTTGMIEICTRVEFQTKYLIVLKPLFKKSNKSKSVKGWRVARIVS